MIFLIKGGKSSLLRSYERLGKEATRIMAQGAKVVMAVRDLEKAQSRDGDKS